MTQESNGMTNTPRSYDPRSFEQLTYHDRLPAFGDGSDSPRAYLERCLEVIAAREPVVQAFATLNEEGARAAADASSERWKAGKPLSLIDGMPIGVKDLLETRDMPTQMGCEAYRGNFPKRDNAMVSALREAGAVILGKTVTAELGGSHPGPTTNPFDPACTPGGSSSGSAAAVGARMIPCAVGTQVGGSIIRPASYCGNVALKPSQGALNRGERQGTSMSTHGFHAGSIEDTWRASIAVARRAGGDRSEFALSGPDVAPAARQPARLIVLETEGWAETDQATRTAFAELLDRISAAGVTLLTRRDCPPVEVLEQAIADARNICDAITGWENRWAHRNLVDQFPDGVSTRLKQGLARAEKMTPDDYHALLGHRAAAQAIHARVGPMADAAILLSSPGPAPLWPGDRPGEPLAPRPTGSPVSNFGTSMLFAPAATVPMMGVGGMPVGVQIMCRPREDAAAIAVARWLLESVSPIVA
jgi:Asp-tRNA(Asn)/Glu-tRNA(Gln) amidotransferase A subunit family amidase